MELVAHLSPASDIVKMVCVSPSWMVEWVGISDQPMSESDGRRRWINGQDTKIRGLFINNLRNRIFEEQSRIEERRAKLGEVYGRLTAH